MEKSASKNEQNSQKWCTELASYVRRIFSYLAQNSDNPIYNYLLAGQISLSYMVTRGPLVELRWNDPTACLLHFTVTVTVLSLLILMRYPAFWAIIAIFSSCRWLYIEETIFFSVLCNLITCMELCFSFIFCFSPQRTCDTVDQNVPIAVAVKSTSDIKQTMLCRFLISCSAFNFPASIVTLYRLAVVVSLVHWGALMLLWFHYCICQYLPVMLLALVSSCL